MLDIGTRISHYRQNKNLTQEELAVKLGVTAQAVSKWERNQSLPDVVTFSQVCNVLNVSADILLDTRGRNLSESNNLSANEEIRKQLRNCQEPLELIIGRDLIEVFQTQSCVKYIEKQRLKLAVELGILMPIVRICDDLRIGPREFVILSYHRVLYTEELSQLDGNTAAYMAGRLGETVWKHYGYILNYDLVRRLVENLRIDYPAVVENIIPDRISYGLLKEVLSGLLERGNGLNYLVKTIEVLDARLRRDPETPPDELIRIAAEEIEREDNYWVWLAKRSESSNGK